MDIWDKWFNKLTIEEIVKVTGVELSKDQTATDYRTEVHKEWRDLSLASRRQIWFDNNNEF